MSSENSYKSVSGKLTSSKIGSNAEPFQLLTLFPYTILYTTWEDFAFKILVLPFPEKLIVLATSTLHFLAVANGHN